MTANFSFEACYEAVKYEIEELHVDIEKAFEEALRRAETDPLYNKNMLKAYRAYIENEMIVEEA